MKQLGYSCPAEEAPNLQNLGHLSADVLCGSLTIKHLLYDGQTANKHTSQAFSRLSKQTSPGLHPLARSPLQLTRQRLIKPEITRHPLLLDQQQWKTVSSGVAYAHGLLTSEARGCPFPVPFSAFADLRPRAYSVVTRGVIMTPQTLPWFLSGICQSDPPPPPCPLPAPGPWHPPPGARPSDP